jgi:hypothetical protein
MGKASVSLYLEPLEIPTEITTLTFLEALLLSIQVVDWGDCTTTSTGINALCIAQRYGSVARLVAPALLHQPAIVDMTCTPECPHGASPTVYL